MILAEENASIVETEKKKKERKPKEPDVASLFEVVD
jgi:hypothetical protein